MSSRYEDNPLSIGRAPLARLNRVTAGTLATAPAKIEGRNAVVPDSGERYPNSVLFDGVFDAKGLAA